ncbi:MAG TPA: hypothetical protein VL651_03235 [Bacteroidia bacterium]|jgi:DNA-directed RNA polymerase subunit delta|nr:hypothetical protein [Bacteroidia bacterium]
MKKQVKTVKAAAVKTGKPAAKVSKAKHAVADDDSDEDLPEELDDYEKPDEDDSDNEIDDSKAKIEKDVDVDFDDLDLDDDDDQFFNDDF